MGFCKPDYSSDWKNDPPSDIRLLNPILDALDYLIDDEWTDERIKKVSQLAVDWLEEESKNSFYQDEGVQDRYHYLEETLIFYPDGQCESSIYIFGDEELNILEIVSILILYEVHVPDIEAVFKLTTILAKLRIIELEFFKGRFDEMSDPESKYSKQLDKFIENEIQRKNSRKDRYNNLAKVLIGIKTDNPEWTWKEVLKDLEMMANDGHEIICSVSDSVIEWVNPKGKIKETRIADLPDRLTSINKKLE